MNQKAKPQKQSLAVEDPNGILVLGPCRMTWKKNLFPRWINCRAGLYILSDSRYFRVSAICKQILDTFDGVSCICRQIVDTLWWGIFYLLADSIYFWQNILDTFRYLADTFEKYLRYYLRYFFRTFRNCQKMAFCLRYFEF